MRRVHQFCLAAVLLLILAGCGQPAYTPITTVEELMEGLVIPAADVVFRSVGYEVSVEGVKEILPADDDEWQVVRANAMALAEAGQLLQFQPAHINDQEWAGFAQMLTDRALIVARTAEAKDPDALLESGGEMYEACLACHEKYLIEETR